MYIIEEVRKHKNRKAQQALRRVRQFLTRAELRDLEMSRRKPKKPKPPAQYVWNPEAPIQQADFGPGDV